MADVVNTEDLIKKLNLITNLTDNMNTTDEKIEQLTGYISLYQKSLTDLKANYDALLEKYDTSNNVLTIAYKDVFSDEVIDLKPSNSVYKLQFPEAIIDNFDIFINDIDIKTKINTNIFKDVLISNFPDLFDALGTIDGDLGYFGLKTFDDFYIFREYINVNPEYPDPIDYDIITVQDYMNIFKYNLKTVYILQSENNYDKANTQILNLKFINKNDPNIIQIKKLTINWFKPKIHITILDKNKNEIMPATESRDLDFSVFKNIFENYYNEIITSNKFSKIKQEKFLYKRDDPTDVNSNITTMTYSYAEFKHGITGDNISYDEENQTYTVQLISQPENYYWFKTLDRSWLATSDDIYTGSLTVKLNKNTPETYLLRKKYNALNTDLMEHFVDYIFSTTHNIIYDNECYYEINMPNNLGLEEYEYIPVSDFRYTDNLHNVNVLGIKSKFYEMSIAAVISNIVNRLKDGIQELSLNNYIYPHTNGTQLAYWFNNGYLPKVTYMDSELSSYVFNPVINKTNVHLMPEVYELYNTNNYIKNAIDSNYNFRNIDYKRLKYLYKNELTLNPYIKDMYSRFSPGLARKNNLYTYKLTLLESWATASKNPERISNEFKTFIGIDIPLGFFTYINKKFKSSSVYTGSGNKIFDFSKVFIKTDFITVNLDISTI